MSEYSLGSGFTGQVGDDAALSSVRAADQPRHRATDRQDSAALTRFEHEQLVREFADIERASAALRLGEPALQSWTKPAASAALKKPRPLWLLIGLLWLSTALLTAGAVAAIATFAG